MKDFLAMLLTLFIVLLLVTMLSGCAVRERVEVRYMHRPAKPAPNVLSDYTNSDRFCVKPTVPRPLPGAYTCI